VSESQLPAEQFTALSALPQVVHGFTLRVPGIEMSHDKSEALARLDGVHREIRIEDGIGAAPFITAQQVHGNNIVIVADAAGDKCFESCDGLITNQRGICLGIYVADCCALYLVDPVRSAIGLVHSGKKGTELGIASKAVEAMAQHFGSRASDLVVQLSPCIRPPHYEIDFAADIVRQCCDLGVSSVNDSTVCTACDLDRYYSYRAEKGRTGRMLAFLALLGGTGAVPSLKFWDDTAVVPPGLQQG
jgi:copper oxidase (laccase) domain-containing protein